MLALIASSDDYLLERRLADVTAAACRSLDVDEPEVLGHDVDPDTVALELQSPSLFADGRVLVVRDVRGWLDTTTPVGAPKTPSKPELDALLAVLGDGLPSGMALVLGAWCGRRPKGALVDAVEAGGDMQWLPLPDPPKPWENVVLSDAQRQVLGDLLRDTAGDVVFTRGAAELLMSRLGFAPRQLVQETTKLVAAAGDAGRVDEDMVRRLTFPAEQSLEAVSEAILERRPDRLVEVIGAADVGTPLRDWQGRSIDERQVPFVVMAQVSALLMQLAVVREVATEQGLEKELDPAWVEQSSWYGRRFKNDLGPRLLDALGDAAPNPVVRDGRKAPTLWRLGQLVRGAARWGRPELAAALEGLGVLERRLRSDSRVEALVAWIASTVPPAEGQAGYDAAAGAGGRGRRSR